MKKMLLLFLLMPLAASAQQQFQGLCARIKIEILQELTLERVGFEATLEITNNDGNDPITDLSATLTFENPLLSSEGDRHDASSLFFVRAPELENINATDGSGLIGPTKKAVMRWFIIPKISAGGADPNGVRYRIGAQLAAKFQGVDIPHDVLQVFPDDIFVKPEPQLNITYFQPRDVQGDDPFTPQVESPIPFTLGVLVRNSGYGIARNLLIKSQQPRIVENRRNLLIIAQLLGVRVMDSPLDRAGLTVNLGDINPFQTRKGAWDMITSLSGEFVEFKASYTHSSELGGEDTSVIKSLEAHFIAHEVINDQPGRDNIRDFLADTDRDSDMIPDALYESEGNVLPVNHLKEAEVLGSAGQGGAFQVRLTADRAGWGYIRLTDPGQARLRIESVIRNDGKILNPRNYWTNLRYEPGSNRRLEYLNIFDLVELGEYLYTITYAPALVDTTPPVTTLEFSGAMTHASGKFHITPETQMFFLSEDESPVSIEYQINGGDFLPALPFRLQNPGEYVITYYATDAAGNREDDKTATLVVSADAPEIADVALSSEPIVSVGDLLSVRPHEASLQFRAAAAPGRLDVKVDIFKGVVGWVTVSNTPSSPTSATTASLSVGGGHVDYYKFSLNNGAWSPEHPVNEPIALTGLASGTNIVRVVGRHQHGDYLPDSKAVAVGWVVNPSAPETRIAGAPATPARHTGAQLTVSGNGVTHYRWTINNGFYRAETNVASPIFLSRLTGTQQVISVIGKVGAVYQPTNNATILSWTLDPAYGSDFSSLARVRSVTFTNVAGQLKTFAWDGRSDAGVVMSPGWYTMRLQVYDELGRTNFTTRLVRIGEFSSGSNALVDAQRGPVNPHARGRWAVWQDQSDGHSQIYARDLGDAAASIRKLTSGALSQEKPQTDGRFVVWQARQPNGNWDVRVKDLASNDPPVAVTSSDAVDEINPSIDWPWIVFQRRATGSSDPWQLQARNLSSGQTLGVWPSTQDQLDPKVQADRVVWQDWRDVGPGEIYLANLESDQRRRITTNTFGQYHPAIHNNWIVWQDNRHGQVEIYGFDLLRNAEIRLTNTPDNEARPSLDGPWLVCEEDSLGVLTSNLRLVHLPSLRVAPITRTESAKTRVTLANGRVVWQDTQSNQTQVLVAELPLLQPVFENHNAVMITETLAAQSGNVYSLLLQWQREAGVRQITRYTSLVPELASQTVVWNNGQLIGPDFPLVPGTFLWVKFDDRRVLDLGFSTAETLQIGPGLNVLSYGRFPSDYSAYRMLRNMNLENVRAVRMLDSESGRWMVAGVQNGALYGNDFAIPRVAVLLLDMLNPLNNWRPE
jgi:beta propeller repeat protein